MLEPASLPGLEDAWRALAPRARTRNPFVGWSFLATWWECFARSRAERTFVLRDAAGEVRAIVPLYLETRRTALGPVRVLRNIGYGDVVNPDFLDALVEPGWEDAVAGALLPRLLDDRGWDYAEFSDLAPAGSLVRMTERWDGIAGLERTVEPRSTCPYIPLPAMYEAYLATLSQKFRYQVRNMRKRIERELEPRWERVGVDLDVATGLELLGGLHQERMEGTGRGGNFRKADYAAFHRRAAQRAAADGTLFFWLLRLRGEPAAAQYGFLQDGVYHGYQMGLAIRWAKRWSVGQYMTGIVIEKLIAEGAREFDMLRGTDFWKFRWTDHVRQTATVTLVRPGASARFARWRGGVAQSPPLALRFLLGRDAFDEIRGAWKRFREDLGHEDRVP